jgi:hypothetical protein
MSLPHSLVAAGCCRVQFIPTAPSFPPLLFPSNPRLRLQHSLRQSCDRRGLRANSIQQSLTNRHRQADPHPLQAEPCSEKKERKKHLLLHERSTSCYTRCRWLLVRCNSQFSNNLCTPVLECFDSLSFLLMMMICVCVSFLLLLSSSSHLSRTALSLPWTGIVHVRLIHAYKYTIQ